MTAAAKSLCLVAQMLLIALPPLLAAATTTSGAIRKGSLGTNRISVEYMDKSITPNVVVKSVAPYAPSTNTSQYGGMNVPDKFEIKVEQKVDTANA